MRAAVEVSSNAMQHRSRTIELVHKAYVTPLTFLNAASAGKPGEFDGGVLYETGAVCQAGVQIKGSYKNVTKAVVDADVQHVPGHHVFGGMVQNTHFGHFLAESLSRLWALQYLGGSFRSIVFYPRVRGKDAPSWVRDLIGLIDPSRELVLIPEVSQFEVLAVPAQIVHTNGFIYGDPAIRAMCEPLRRVTADRAKKLYVSRSELKPHEGGVLLEKLIEQNLQEEGYEVLHPQKASIRTQIEAYNAADKLVFAEGSAIHLYALVARPEQRAFAIWRRKMPTTFDWQLKSFGATGISGKSSIRELWVPDIPFGAMTRTKANIDFDDLRAQLVAGGFIKGDRWGRPRADEVDAELARLQAENKAKYVVGAPP
ncbi:glycosyltransferase 61 family protein [Rhodoplanes roseus]|uniref:Glycosyltransferase 61 catalytic domain-containing protein n=1 Tax=Rhodoplanes roseus TaxID=29409 RepID=A0A327L3A9_9BRAD|nr:glycosyltransferase 61 family protein [Rhodoplanes roseus]RAI44991.1 hypothetical protein CH341_06150 [Rhodoplanes roseus]